MNERIRELALKSGIAYLSEQTAYFKANDGLTVLPSIDSLEKFAELIVRECCLKLETDGMVEVAMEMKEHFGVEE